MPPAEVFLWQRLRRGQLNGLKFRRQYGVGPYIVDFYCASVRLAIELDGLSHEGEVAEQYDSIRQAHIESLGITVVRFKNQLVYEGMDEVLENIEACALRLQAARRPPPAPPCSRR